MKVGFVTIAFNAPDLIIPQIEAIRRLCTDAQYDIVIFDNSNDTAAGEAIRYHVQRLGAIYHRVKAKTGDSSMSHSFAANISYMKLREEGYTHLAYLDHDLYPIRPFSVVEILGEKLLGGMSQTKPSGKTYIWPGLLLIRNDRIDRDLVDFSVNHEFGLDTGGNLYKLVEQCGFENCIFFDEVHVQNHLLPVREYPFYSEIYNGVFMHMGKGSNWNGMVNHGERIRSLLSVLGERIRENDESSSNPLS